MNNNDENDYIVDDDDMLFNQKIDEKFIKKYSQISENESKKIFDNISNAFKNENYETLLENELTTSQNEQSENDEVSTPYKLSKIILNHIDDNYFLTYPRILDYCCGKGSIIYQTFINLVPRLLSYLRDYIIIFSILCAIISWRNSTLSPGSC